MPAGVRGRAGRLFRGAACAAVRARFRAGQAGHGRSQHRLEYRGEKVHVDYEETSEMFSLGLNRLDNLGLNWVLSSAFCEFYVRFS